VSRLETERWYANGDVFGAVGSRRAVAHPFAATRNDGLAGFNIEHALLRFDPERAAQDQGELIEVRLLAGLGPARWAVHVGDADGGIAGIHAADVLFDQLVSGDGNARRAFYQGRHEFLVSRFSFLVAVISGLELETRN